MKVLERATADDIGDRIDALDWADLEAQLDSFGCATASALFRATNARRSRRFTIATAFFAAAS